MSSLIHSFEVMTNPSTAGPVTICIPQDVQAEAFNYDLSFFKKRVHYVNRQIPTERELALAVTPIKSRKKPVIIVGGGVKYSNASEELIAFATQCHIPFVETPAGKGTVAYDCPYNLGGTGILGTAAANQAISESDLIIGIGTRYTDFTTSSKTAFDFEHTAFLNVNVTRMQTYKFDASKINADAKETLARLLPLLKEYSSDFGSSLKEWKDDWNLERERLHHRVFTSDSLSTEIDNQFDSYIMDEYVKALGTKFTQTNAFITINDLVAKDAIPVASAGSLPGDMQRLWIPHTTNSYHLEYGYSCMGYEIAGAFGVKIAKPNQEVYAFVGDGSFLMLHTELVTSLQYGYKINIILFDNSGFGCINNLQMANGSGSFNCEFRTYDNHIMNIDYAKVAEGYGAKSYRVHNQEELKAAIDDAKKQTISTLIDIKVLPKTMSNGYNSWWHVGISEISEKKEIQKAFYEKEKKLENAWKY